jgi:hypothetical protein
VRGYAHVIKEDTVAPNLLFLGTEFGLWISIDSGRQWAQYKGGEFPNVAVRDLVVHPRDSDLIIATHGRGIWIVDDITPLRALTPDVLSQSATFISGRPTQQRLTAYGGWSNGNAVFVGSNPPDAALITYYQQKRHIFGKMTIQVFDPDGKLLETLPANARRGLTRVQWGMRLKPPRVPPAVSLAGEASIGARVLPGTYTIKMTRGSDVYTEKLTVGLDPRATYTVEDRKLQLDAVRRVSAVLDDMSYQVARINSVRDALVQRAAKLDASDPLRGQLTSLSARVDDIRRKIVATKEGGAITGELRLREYTTELYGDFVFYEGRPGDYQVARIDSLRRELDDVSHQFDGFVAADLAATNQSLAQKKLEPVLPVSRGDWEKTNPAPGTENAAGTAAAAFRREIGERD